MSSYIFQNPKKILEPKQNKYLQLVSKLETLSPLATIKRGYTITKKDNKVITSTKELKKNDKIEITLTDGTINAENIINYKKEKKYAKKRRKRINI